MAGDSDPAQLTATEARDRLQSGALTVEGLAAACLARIAAREPAVCAWTHVDRDAVLAQARAMDRSGPRAPLYGLPVGIKDVIATRDMPTRYNSPLYDQPGPTADAAPVAILRAAGALILGKTHTVEFAATGRPPPTRNPHAPSRTPGGSSSGSAAAVADGHVPLALGTQTGGSMIRPAAFCGVHALKPTWGTVGRDGVKALAPTLDTLGWFARSAADLALLYALFDPGEPAPPPPIAGLRVAVCRTPMWERAEAASQDALLSLAERLARAGARVEEIALPAPLEQLPDWQRRIMQAEGGRTLLAEYATSQDGLHPNLRAMVEDVGREDRSALLQAYDSAAWARAAFDALAAPYDGVLAPSTVGEAPEGLAATGDMIFNGLWTLLHVPCVNLPGAIGPGGLPIGLTLAGPRFSDRRLLGVAQALAPYLAG